MFQKIKNSILVVATLLVGAAPVVAPAVVYAATDLTNSNTIGALCDGTNIAGDKSTTTATGDTSCASDSSASTDGLYGIAKNVVNIFSVIVGIVAVIMIIFGGFKYITSGGDSGNVSGAKNTLIYAIVGLIIVALAQFIVHFVIHTAAGVQ